MRFITTFAPPPFFLPLGAFWIALHIRQSAAIVSLIAVAIAPLEGGILFCFCIKPDMQLMKQALEQAEKEG
jgi:hypothetical protein